MNKFRKTSVQITKGWNQYSVSSTPKNALTFTRQTRESSGKSEKEWQIKVSFWCLPYNCHHTAAWLNNYKMYKMYQRYHFTTVLIRAAHLTSWVGIVYIFSFKHNFCVHANGLWILFHLHWNALTRFAFVFPVVFCFRYMRSVFFFTYASENVSSNLFFFETVLRVLLENLHIKYTTKWE